MPDISKLVTFTIDENLRTITVPTEGSVLGVQGDISVNRVAFVMPRYFRDFDLTEFTARVNYANPNGDANYYESDDIAAEEENTVFTWLLSPDVTSYIGTVSFSVTLYKKTEDVVTQKFNTKVATGKVLEGLEVESYITPEAQKTLVEKISEEVKSSITESLKTETSEAISADIEKKKTAALNEMENKKTSAVTEIEDKKTSAVKEINSEQIVRDVSQLKEDVKNSLKTYNEIKPLEIVDGKILELSTKKFFDNVKSCYTKTEIPKGVTELKISGHSANSKYDYGIGAFYDGDYNYIQSIPSDSNTEYINLYVEVPSNAKYIVVNFYTNKTKVKNILANIITPNELEKTKNLLLDVHTNVLNILKKIEFNIVLSITGYNTAKPSSSAYIGWSDDTNFRCSDLIKCSDFAYLDVTAYGNEWMWQVAFFDKDRTFMPQVSITGDNSVNTYSVDIPNEAVYLQVCSNISSTRIPSAKIMLSKENIDKSIDDLNKRLSSLEDNSTSLFEDTEFALFHTFGIIGDSLSVGHTVSKDGKIKKGRNIYYSWGQYLARRLGNNCLNFGRSGVSAKLWMSTSEQYCYPRLVDPNNLCQAYIIALGANDTSMTIGSISDVNFSDMTQNADTEYGWYAKIINAVRTIAPKAPIFLFTLPYPRNSDDNIKAINEMIRKFGSDRTHFGKIFTVDLDANYNEYFKDGKLRKQVGNTGWHLTSLGYMYASHVNQKALSKIISDNYSDFQDVFMLPYGSNTILD